MSDLATKFGLGLGGGGSFIVPGAPALSKGSSKTYIPFSNVLYTQDTTYFQFGANTLYYVPFYIPKAVTISHITSVQNNSTSNNGKKIRQSIYVDADGFPGALKISAAEITCNGSAYTVNQAVASATLEKGWYWAMSQSDSDPRTKGFAMPTVSSNAAMGIGTFNEIGTITTGASKHVIMPGHTKDLTYAAAVDPASAPTGDLNASTNIPFFGLVVP